MCGVLQCNQLEDLESIKMEVEKQLKVGQAALTDTTAELQKVSNKAYG